MTVVDAQLWCGPGHSQQCFACDGDCGHNAASGWLPGDDERARGARFVRVVFDASVEPGDVPCLGCGTSWSFGEILRQFCLDCLRGGRDVIGGHFFRRAMLAAIYQAWLLRSAEVLSVEELRLMIWDHDLGVEGVLVGEHRFGCRVFDSHCNSIGNWVPVSDGGGVPVWPSRDGWTVVGEGLDEERVLRDAVRVRAANPVMGADWLLKWTRADWQLPSFDEYERAEELVRQRVLVEGLEICAPARPLAEFDWYRWEVPEDRDVRAGE